MDPRLSMAMHEYCNINAKFKKSILVICLLSILFEWNAIQLFLWPVEHSCARSANLTSYSSLLVDARNDSISADVVQRNLIDATPEDSFTLARATSMGIEYDDIARCFEYPVDFADNRTKTTTTINMESLETCRYGMHFETNEPTLSIIERFNLTCTRQWLKNLLQQAFALGLLIGCLACHYELQRKQASGARVFSRSSFVLALVWLIVFVATKRLDDIQRKSNQLNEAHSNSDLVKLVLSILLRSVAVCMTLCRVLATWVSLADDGPYDPSFKESHRYFKTFALMLILCKMLFAPLALRLIDNWSILNRFLTFNMTLVVSLSLLIELAHSPEQLVRLRLYLIGRGTNSRSRKAGASSRWQPIEFGRNSGDEDDDELDSSISRVARREADPTAIGFRAAGFPPEASSSRVCEFCSVKEKKIYAPSAQSAAAGRPDSLTIETTMSTPCSQLFDPLGPIRSTYEPTTMSLSAANKFMSADVQLSDDGGDISNRRRPFKTASSATRVRHNVSLLEMELSRWTLIRKLLLLTFCLAFNYFLMQTIPNHKLLHSEPIASLQARKTSHVHGQLSSANGSSSSGSAAADKEDKLHFILLEGSPSVSSNQATGEAQANNITLTSNTTLAYLPLAHGDKLPESIAFVSTSDHRSLHSTGNSLTPSQEPGANSAPASQRPQGATDDSEQQSQADSSGSGYAIQNVTHSLAGDSGEGRRPGAKDANSSKGGTASVANATHATPPPRTRPAQLANITTTRPTLGVGKNNETLGRAREQVHASQHELSQRSSPVSRDAAAGTASRAQNAASGKNAIINNNNDDDEGSQVAHKQSAELRVAPTARDDDSSSLSSSSSADASVYELLFDYKTRNYATNTLDTLRDSNNPLEILWTTMSLNGWPIELAVMLLHSASLTNFQSNNFKLKRLFVLAKHGTMLLVFEWLLVALIRAKDHLIGLEWLLLVILTLARFLTSLLLYGHLHMLLRLAHKVQSNALLKPQHALPTVLCALALALMAPIVERIDLIIIPASILLSNLLARYLVSKVDGQLRGLLCPMMFEHDE